MKKFNVFFALLLGAMVSFTACSKDDELTAEELEAKQTKELIETITANFETITSKEWAFKEFVSSEALITAAKDPDNTVANETMKVRKHVGNFKPVLSFEAIGDLIKPSVSFGLTDEEIENKIMDYQSDAYPDWPAEWGLVFSVESYSAKFRRAIAAPLAADDLKIDDITSEETGLCIFKMGMNDFSKLSYDDVVLAQKRLIAGNSDKMYINEDGTLTVETTSEKFGVSKLILEEVE